MKQSFSWMSDLIGMTEGSKDKNQKSLMLYVPRFFVWMNRAKSRGEPEAHEEDMNNR